MNRTLNGPLDRMLAGRMLAGRMLTRLMVAGLAVAACQAPAPDTLVVSSDPELAAVARELLPDLAARSGLELRGPVRLERRSREQLVRYLTAKVDEQLPPDEAERVTRSYALLGLVPEDLDLRALLLSVYTEQVAGFYDPDSAALFVMDDQPEESLRTVLVHELVHAVQDQSWNLDSLTARERGNDRQTAAQAAIEGHATLVMLEYMMEQMGASVDLSEVEGFGGLLRPALEGVRAQYPALARAPRVIQEALLFPYLEGAGFVQRLWREHGGRPPPFGEFLPESTEQVLHPERLLGAGRRSPREIELRIPGGRVVHTDGLGQLETGLLLEALSGDPASAAAAVGWRGDRYALLEPEAEREGERAREGEGQREGERAGEGQGQPDGERAGEGEGGEALVWVAVWDDEAARDGFARRLGEHLARLPRTSTLDLLEVDGLAALILRVGVVGEVEASLTGAAAAGAGAQGR